MKRRFQDQPAQPARERHAQLRRFMGTRARRKIRYGALLTNALDLRCVPRALDAVLAHARHWRAAGSVSIRTIEHLIASGELRAVRVRRSVRVTPEALDAYISGLPCQSANAQVASKSVSASAVVGASNGRSRPAPSAATRSRSKLLCAVPSSIRS